MNRIIEFRRELHRHPELSGCEAVTANMVLSFFEPLGPDRVIGELGGHGLAFVFEGGQPGPTVLLRCDLDALSIQESPGLVYGSATDGVSHKCGHDGHMAIMAGVGLKLAEARPEKGRVVLLYQPAEENGRGARAVIDDPRFDGIRPDMVFALHNLPGFPLGEVVLRSGTFCFASRGMEIDLIGTTAHAAQPETGRNPTAAMCRIISELGELPRKLDLGNEIAFATVVGADLGLKSSFGTAPGRANVMATLRSESDESMARMISRVENLVKDSAVGDGLDWNINHADEFPATANSPAAVEIVRRAAGDLEVTDVEAPFRWSEDFGHFTGMTKGALFGLGAGVDTPDLHHPAYDFPDALLEKGVGVYLGILREVGLR